MPTLAVYGDSFADTNSAKWQYADTKLPGILDKYNNSWPVILSKMLNAELVCYAKNGTNRQWAYENFKATAGLHDYYVIVHTYYDRIFGFNGLVDKEIMRFGYWTPEKETFPDERFRTAFEEYFRVFYSPEINQIAHVGFNHAFTRIIGEKNIPQDRIMHLFLDPDNDFWLGPAVCNTFGLNDGTHNYLSGLSQLSMNEIHHLRKDPVLVNDFIGEDLRSCHFTWANNGKIAELIHAVFDGTVRGKIDPTEFLLPEDHPTVRSQIETLRKNKDSILLAHKKWDHIIK